MTTHEIEPARRTLHGHFSRDIPPVLTVDPGDTVRFRTLDARWWLDRPEHDGTPTHAFERVKGEDDGHALCGPVAVRGAKAGMTLGIQIGEITTGSWGWNRAGGWSYDVNDRLGVSEQSTFFVWDLDPEQGTATNQHGHRVALRPFMGVMGMPPAVRGKHATRPPRTCGGNIDCKELVAGTTLYLPIAVDGALFSTGDGHAVQSDGESSSTAIECPIERVDLTFQLYDDLPLTTPRARTDTAWITFGFHEDLNEATMIALEAMLELMGKQYGVSRTEALALASLVVDLRVTQIVNQVRGVHAVIEDGALDKV